MSLLKLPLAAVVLSLSSLSCGVLKKDDDNSSSAPAPVTPVAGSVEANLQGTWKTACEKGSSNNYNLFMNVISGNQFSIVSQISDAANCSNPDLEIAVKSTFVSAPATQRSGLHRIELTRGETTIKALNKSNADLLNLVKMCGFTDWTPNVAKAIRIGMPNCLEKDIIPEHAESYLELEGNTMKAYNPDDLTKVVKTYTK